RSGGVVSHVSSFELLILELQKPVVESGAADAGVRSTPGPFHSDKTSKRNNICPSSTLSRSSNNRRCENPALHSCNNVYGGLALRPPAAVPAAPEAPLKRPTTRLEPRSVDAQVRNAAVVSSRGVANPAHIQRSICTLPTPLLPSGRGCDQAPRPSSSSLEHTRGLRVAGHRGAYWYHLPVP
ncbi:hypothetical protein FB451DRAFT_1222941, partial [Mycena latifolia]